MSRENRESKLKSRRVYPRISSDWYHKLSLVAKQRNINLSELTRSLYRELLEREFPNKKPAPIGN